MKSLPHTIQKIWPMLKFLQTDKPKNICPRSFDMGHKKKVNTVGHNVLDLYATIVAKL
jgi:hypothetical protein